MLSIIIRSEYNNDAYIIIIGTTRTVTRAPILMYWAGLSRIASPRERRLK